MQQTLLWSDLLPGDMLWMPNRTLLVVSVVSDGDDDDHIILVEPMRSTFWRCTPYGEVGWTVYRPRELP